MKTLHKIAVLIWGIVLNIAFPPFALAVCIIIGACSLAMMFIVLPYAFVYTAVVEIKKLRPDDDA